MFYPIVFMLFVLPGLIIAEGFKMLRRGAGKHWWRNLIYIIVLVLCLWAITFFLNSF